MKIVVLAGGMSPERDVSLSSGALIATALMERGHSVALADVYKPINTAEIDKMFRSEGKYEYRVPASEPDLDNLKKDFGEGERLIGRGIIELCEKADAVFLALHGGMGEDGRIEALLESCGIKHSGSDYASCHLAMDKALTKAIFESNGIPTPKWNLYCDEDISEIPTPCVVKPCGCGSSVGVTIVETPRELEKAISLAKSYGAKVMIEEKITGREFSVGILGGKALPAIEIIPKTGFYDYKNKYQAGATEEICPADLTESQAEEMGRIALRAHNALGLGMYSRLDFLMDRDGNFFCLEANALPGMTPSSLLPQEAKAAGIDYITLCEMIVSSPV
ncbi:MAG: D-alanine--D-alanine ligase [Eubacteriales bacterium]|nr:D-alanine--D-alanine ligase [Eubacterium sp.]MDD7179857.1 D-alanine--D-alanine ligase [Eubacterium sp.]MDY5493446.1 D-alanine--D-alanine ligase [Eubacteriales bacterium]